jgi:hypothetical protein
MAIDASRVFHIYELANLTPRGFLGSSKIPEKLTLEEKALYQRIRSDESLRKKLGAAYDTVKNLSES